MRRTVCYITVTVMLHCYPFAVRLDRYIGSCNTLNNLSNKVCVPLKTEDLHIHYFNVITGKNESKTFRIHISCECKCKYDERKPNSNQKQDNSDCQYKCTSYMWCEKDYIWNSSTCSCKNGKYLASITDNSVITRDEIIDDKWSKTLATGAKSNDEATKSVPSNFNEKENKFVKSNNSLFYFSFY